MGLKDYQVSNDCFEESPGANPAGLSFPCCCCRHATGKDTDEPCASCGHNANSK